MPLDGTALHGYLDRAIAYMHGEEPQELTPAAGGDAVPMMVASRGRDPELVLAGEVAMETLTVRVRERLTEGAVYTYDGLSWTCRASIETSLGGRSWPWGATLVAHAR